MSGRVRVTLADGRRVIGFRKTLAQRRHTPPHLLPDWRLGFVLPAPVSFAIAPGRYPTIAGATVDPAGYVTIAGKRKDWVLSQARMLLADVAPQGLISPLPIVLERGDEPGPADSGPIRKGEVRQGSITWTGRQGTIVLGRSQRPL